MSTRNQLELNLAGKRTRAVLKVTEPAPPIGVPTLLSLSLSDRGKEMFIGYTPWFSSSEAKPPCSGLWDLILDGGPPVRVLYALDLDVWADGRWPFPRTIDEYQWRGLCQDWNEVFGHEVNQKPRRAVLIEN